MKIHKRLQATDALTSLVLLAALGLPVVVFPGEAAPDQLTAERALKMLRKDTMPADAADQITAGYYEDLFDFSSRTISTSRLITGRWATNWSRYEGLRMNRTDQRVPGFLYYETRPNLDVPEFGGRLVTNRWGMADRDYNLEPATGTRRIALIGDSISRGLGATHGKAFEALLEDRLNATASRQDAGRYEILNFAVGGYRITQYLWVLENKAARFHPQVHVVVFTNLTVFRKWSDHIVQLVHSGIDLHYPYLKDLAARADLRPGDDPVTFQEKLAPYRDDVLKWALETMQASADKQSAGLVVLLVPSISDPVQMRETFGGARDLVEGLGIPVVDVIDAFSGVADLSPYRIGPLNHHPTDAGHAFLADRIFDRLRQHPRAWQILTGAR